MAADAWTREDSERMLDGHFTHWVHAAAMPDEDESYEVVLTHRALACCGEPFEGRSRWAREGHTAARLRR